MYIIQRDEDGKYVSRLGSKHSYTRILEDARVWVSRDTAERERCGNEQVVQVEEVMPWT